MCLYIKYLSDIIGIFNNDILLVSFHQLHAHHLIGELY